MEDIILSKFTNGTRLVATTNSPMSHNGIPIIYHEGCSECSGNFNPTDIVPECLRSVSKYNSFGILPFTMAALVKIYATDLIKYNIDFLLDERGREQIECIILWLVQNPNGPHILIRELWA